MNAAAARSTVYLAQTMSPDLRDAANTLVAQGALAAVSRIISGVNKLSAIKRTIVKYAVGAILALVGHYTGVALPTTLEELTEAHLTALVDALSEDGLRILQRWLD